MLLHHIGRDPQLGDYQQRPIKAEFRAVTVPFIAVQNGPNGPRVFIIQPDRTAAVVQVKIRPRVGDVTAPPWDDIRSTSSCARQWNIAGFERKTSMQYKEARLVALFHRIFHYLSTISQ